MEGRALTVHLVRSQNLGLDMVTTWGAHACWWVVFGRAGKGTKVPSSVTSFGLRAQNSALEERREPVALGTAVAGCGPSTGTWPCGVAVRSVLCALTAAPANCSETRLPGGVIVVRPLECTSLCEGQAPLSVRMDGFTPPGTHHHHSPGHSCL